MRTYSAWVDRKSTRLNSSHLGISYAVFCLESEEHTSELQSLRHLVCRLLLEKNRSDRKSTRLNSSHLGISYAVFCLSKPAVPPRGWTTSRTDNPRSGAARRRVRLPRPDKRTGASHHPSAPPPPPPPPQPFPSPAPGAVGFPGNNTPAAPRP